MVGGGGVRSIPFWVLINLKGRARSAAKTYLFKILETEVLSEGISLQEVNSPENEDYNHG